MYNDWFSQNHFGCVISISKCIRQSMCNFKYQKMSKENYEAKLEELEKMPQEEVKSPTTPVDVSLQEAEDLYVWSIEDRSVLESKGLNWESYTEEIPIRAGALRYAQSEWMKERFGREAAIKIWREESPKAYDLRNNLIADLRFAYRSNPNLMNRVRALRGGQGDANMIQDLSDISVLGKANTKELTAINFDLAILETAAQRADELAELLARAKGARYESMKVKDMRDRAYTYLKEVGDEVRAYGKYAFRKDPQRFQGYISRYKK